MKEAPGYSYWVPLVLSAISLLGTGGNWIWTAQLETERKQAETESIKQGISRHNMPSLELRPVILQPESKDDVRSIQLETNIINTGNTTIDIKSVKVSVAVGEVTPEVGEVLTKTMQFAEAQRILNPNNSIAPSPVVPANYESDPKRKWAEERKREHSTACPHGLLFLIDDVSPHVTWTPLEHVERQRHLQIALRPTESVSHQFNYLLTANVDKHRQWLRYRIAVNEGQPDQREYEFVLPTDSSYDGTSYTVAHTSYETKTKVLRWTPTSALRPNKEPINYDEEQKRKAPPVHPK